MMPSTGVGGNKPQQDCKRHATTTSHMNREHSVVVSHRQALVLASLHSRGSLQAWCPKPHSNHAFIIQTPASLPIPFPYSYSADEAQEFSSIWKPSHVSDNTQPLHPSSEAVHGLAFLKRRLWSRALCSSPTAAQHGIPYQCRELVGHL